MVVVTCVNSVYDRKSILANISMGQRDIRHAVFRKLLTEREVHIPTYGGGVTVRQLNG